MLDHEDHLDSPRLTPMYLPIDRFKRKMDVSDEDSFDSLPSALTEMRKGCRACCGSSWRALSAATGIS